MFLWADTTVGARRQEAARGFKAGRKDKGKRRRRMRPRPVAASFVSKHGANTSLKERAPNVPRRRAVPV